MNFKKGDRVIHLGDCFRPDLKGRHGAICCFVEDVYPGEILKGVEGGVGVELDESYVPSGIGPDECDCKGFAKKGHGVFTNIDVLIHEKEILEVKEWLKLNKDDR